MGREYMRNISIWFVIFLGLTLYCVIALGSIYDEKDKITFMEETLQGDIMAMDGLELDIDYCDYNYLWWDINVSYSQGMEADVSFKPLYERYSGNTIKNQVIIVGDSVYDELNKVFEEMGNGIKEIKISDYISYMSMNFAVSFDDFRRYEFEGDNDLYKIKVPESAVAIIEKEHNSYGVEIRDIPYVGRDLPSVVIGDRMYFTIPNLDMANMALYQGIDSNDLEYELKSGILSIPVDKNKKDDISYNEIKAHYPLELNQDSNQYIIGMEYITEEGLIVLVTLEDNKIYGHLFDPSRDSLIIKKEISQIPEDKMLRYAFMNSQDNYLLVHYKYGKEVQSFEEVDYNYLVETYEIKNNDIVKIMGNDYLNKLDSKYKEYWYVDFNGLYYADNKMYLVGRDQRGVGEANTGLLLMGLNNEDILYFGSLNNSMMEDYTIATTRIDEPLLVRGMDRTIESFNIGFR